MQCIYQKADPCAWYVTDTVYARISAQLQISALLREKMSFGTQYYTRDVYSLYDSPNEM